MDVKPTYKPNKCYSVLCVEERATIAAMLRDGHNAAEIAEALNRSVSTVTREIKKYSVKEESSGNHCLLKMQGLCKKKGVCGGSCDTKLCHRCRMKKCWERCTDYTPAYCDKLYTAPYVCNGCPDISKCNYDKAIYDIKYADRTAHELRHNKAKGYDYTDVEMESIDQIISPMVKNGMSPYAALTAARPELDKLGIHLGKSTLYKMINDSVLSCRNIDLPERVSRKPPKTKKRNHGRETIPTMDKAGRLWGDYQKFIAENDCIVPQMDCVEGKKTDQAALLTLFWSDTHLQIAFILSAQDSKNVVEALDKLEAMIGLSMFRQMLPAILTDNGHEFTDIQGMERSSTVDREKRTRIFFCEPNRSDQKGGCERNHREMRRVIPKGKISLDIFMQMDISLMMDHVNSYPRESLHGKSPYDVASVIYPADFMDMLGLERIPPGDVVLSPSLLAH